MGLDFQLQMPFPCRRYCHIYSLAALSDALLKLPLEYSTKVTLLGTVSDCAAWRTFGHVEPLEAS